MPSTKSILRYPGGKTQLTKFVQHTIELNHIESPIYCEPFCGGAGVAMALLLNKKASSIVLNDADSSVYSIWKAVLYDTPSLISRIQSAVLTMDEWEKQRKIYMSLRDIPGYHFDLAFAALYLNRTNRSGIISGGPIGGHDQKSKYTLGCRFTISTLVSKIKSIADHKDQIELYNEDGLQFIQNHLLAGIQMQHPLFVFFDPPYYAQGQALYKNGLTPSYHESLAHSIQQLQNLHWITTYDNVPEIRDLYKDVKGYTYQLRYSANSKRKESELFFCSPITRVESFDKVDLN